MMFPKKQKSKRKTQAHKPSILQDRKECYITRKRYGASITVGLHKHHIYFGDPNRSISEANGFIVYLLPEYHTGSNIAVHGRDGRALDLELKRDCQRVYEAAGNSRESFIKLIGKSYLGYLD